MEKRLTDLLREHRHSLREQILASSQPTKDPNSVNEYLVDIIEHILDLLIEEAEIFAIGNNASLNLSHKLLALTANKDPQVCLPGLGPALFNLRSVIFSLCAMELPQDDWPVYYLHLSNGIDACLLNDHTLAQHAASAIETARKLAEVEAHSRREAGINTINRAIRSSLELKEIIQSVATELGQLLNVSRLAIYRATSEKILMLEHQFCPDKSGRSPDLLMSMDNPLIRQAIETRQPVIINNIDLESLDSNWQKSLQWLKSRAQAYACLIHAIFLDERVWGLIYITETTGPRYWALEDISLVESVADQLIIAIRQAGLFTQVARANQEWITTFDAMSDALFILDRKKLLSRANRSALTFLNKTAAEVLGTDSALLHPIFRDTQNLLAQVISSGARKTFAQSYGEPPKHLIISADPICTEQGESLGAVCVIRDVTEVKRVEAETQTQKQFFASLIENAYDAIYALDLNGHFTWANPRTQTIFGYLPEELKGREINSLVMPESLDNARNAFEMAAKGNPKIQEQQFQHTDGNPRLAIVTYSPLFVGGRINGVLAVARDITQERRVAEVASQADKLQALGQMASGVAHDFNNVLATIIGRTQLLKRFTEQEQLRRGLDIIETAALDGASTARRIQNFSRLNPVSEFQPLELNSLVRECLEFTSTRWKDDAHAKGLKYEVGSTLSDEIHSQGDASELREVLVNLIFNALDAMPQGGQLHITTAIEDDLATIRVSDSGIGMSDNTKRRIFEPFFTTKGSAGTGLGLSVSLSIISHHGGTIDIDSEPDHGTTFIIRLPVVATAKSEPVEPTPPAYEAILAGKIVIIDDEDSVREVLADILEILGHTVCHFSNGRDCLARLATEKFDVVFTDLAMPDMDGWALSQLVREYQPGIKIVLMTGYGSDISSDRQNKVDAIVSKPFDMNQLRSVLAMLLPKS